MQRLICVDYIWQHTLKPALNQKDVLHFYPTLETPALLHQGTGTCQAMAVAWCSAGVIWEVLSVPAVSCWCPQQPSPPQHWAPLPGNGHASSKGVYLCYTAKLGPAQPEQAQTRPSDSPTAAFHSMGLNNCQQLRQPR